MFFGKGFYPLSHVLKSKEILFRKRLFPFFILDLLVKFSERYFHDLANRIVRISFGFFVFDQLKLVLNESLVNLSLLFARNLFCLFLRISFATMFVKRN